jgi:ribonucleoside-diphosphate reductase alpha chain
MNILPVFDCANKCGQNRRTIYSCTWAHPYDGLLHSLSLSGAISKTINLPHEASIEEIADCYRLSWELGLKANALYRDGSKLSQPLSNKSDKKKSTNEKEEAAEAEAD